MLKLMIADDEPKIRRDLRGATDWGALGIKVVGEAEDGEIALQLAEKTRPDLLLVDINMPFLSGLEFISRVRQILPDSETIIITVYDDFEYAQKALRLQTFDYILKPVDRDQLLSVIGRAKAALEKGRTLRRQVLQTGRQVQKNLESLKGKFLLDLLNDRLTPEEAEDQASFFAIPFGRPWGMMAVKVLDRVRLTAAGEMRGRRQLLLEAQDVARTRVSSFFPVEILSDEQENLLVLSQAENLLAWDTARQEIENAASQKLQFATVGAAIVCAGGLASAREAYRVLLEQLKERSECTPIVILIRNYMEENFCDPELSLQETAEKIHISPSYLSKALKREIGLSFVDFLTQLRIQKAIQLMKDPCRKIHEVAEKVGYSDQHYFSTAFKKVLGLSPAEYRRRG